MASANLKSSPEDAARMAHAQQRLEDLLRGAGPEITVTPADGRYPVATPAPPQSPAKTANTQQTAVRAPRPSRIVSPQAAATQQTNTPAQPRAKTTTPLPATPQAPRANPVPSKPHVAKRVSPSQPPAPKATPRRAQPVPPPIRQSAAPQPRPLSGTRIPAAPKRTVTGEHGELAQALLMSKRAFMAAGLFSFVINLLMLAGPLFMLQVYDRVLASGSIPTLVVLSLMTAAAYLIIGILELVRSRVIVRMGLEVDERISTRVFNASLRHSLAGTGQSNHALRELESIRQFVASPGPMAFFDAPWTPIYLLVIFMAHWILGIAATLGALVLLAIAWRSEAGSRDPQIEAGVAAARAIELAETGQRNAEALTAMGMVGAYRARWDQANGETLAWQLKATDCLSGMTALSKTCKLLFQSMMLAIGAALAINGAISAGAIIAATIIFGRALAPVDQAIGHWRQFLKSRTSFAKLEALLKSQPPTPTKTALPPPKGHLHVANLKVPAPGTQKLILANIAFKLEPGQVVAVIGPSASGKSSLVRTLVGIWTPAAGTITLDGARLDQWDSEALGKHIGYLPQSVELFSGTVKENIARFVPDARDEEVVEAAKQAHTHDLILALPNGYDTQLGPYATHLSGGQRQRLALARAMFRRPALVVLDEPNANLDREGDVALADAIDGMRARGQAVVLVSHRVQAIGKADLLLYLERGIQRAFGPREQVMKMLQAGADNAQQQNDVVEPGAQKAPSNSPDTPPRQTTTPAQQQQSQPHQQTKDNTRANPAPTAPPIKGPGQ